ncbi:hypothetical protein HYALB_00008595 [Hymenoscyphus albidus]|uniref:Indole-diterpene biosynthesis protein PaxU n=1 Tax=Hymenoscyphus albidus TaxID=595503 RepID=A0A9N9LC81_9HELO|nr:hypothetical protein HYALB_00008595 [Hymenoscyphus albidus]
MAVNSNKYTKLEFKQLNPIVSLFSPTPTTPIDPCHPSTIIFCAWMEASPRSRYVNSFFDYYHDLYPNARIICVISRLGFFSYTSTTTRCALHEPIISAIEAGPSPNGKRNILAHVFCNGGSLAFADIRQQYKENTGRKLEIKAIVFDSGPGEYSFSYTYQAAAPTFPKGLLWYPVAGFILVAIFLLGRTKVGPYRHVEGSRRRINDLEYADEKEKRVYIYSDTDLVVGCQSVEAHAADARAKGIDVSLVPWKGSRHIQHMLQEESRYWDVVTNFWAGKSSSTMG